MFPFAHLILGGGGGGSSVTSLVVDICGFPCSVILPAHCSLGETVAQVPCFALALEWAQDQTGQRALSLSR